MNELQNITTRDIVAVLYSLGVFILLFMKIPVPDQIWSGLILILTFFFMAPKANTNTTVASVTAPTTASTVQEAANRG